MIYIRVLFTLKGTSRSAEINRDRELNRLIERDSVIDRDIYFKSISDFLVFVCVCIESSEQKRNKIAIGSYFDFEN